MLDPIKQNNYVKFITNLITCLRQISIYPPKHPIVVNSIKAVYSSVNLIFIDQKALSIFLSPDNKMTFDGEIIGDKSTSTFEDFSPYFKKLDIEGLIFNPGITEEEIGQFISLLISDPETVKKAGDINQLFSQKGIQHILAKQFSYLKVEKGKEGVVVEDKLGLIEKLKATIHDFASGKLQKHEDVQTLQKEIFNLLKQEFKETQKLSAPLKTLFKKFLQNYQDKDELLAKLREALLEYGCPQEDVEKLVAKISEEFERPAPVRKRPVPEKEFQVLQKENEKLKSSLDSLQQAVGEKIALVEKLEKENKRTKDEKQRVDNIIHNLAEGMVVVDSQGKIILVNPAAEVLLGITKDDIGKPIREVVKDEHLLTLTKTIPADKDAAVEKDIELISADETTKKILRTSQAVVEDPNGNTIGMVTMLNDITKQRELEKMKENFLSGISHELRTPLVAIEKSVSLILSKATGELSEPQSQFLSIAERNLKRLTLLINDLLDLSKLEANRMELKREQTSLDNIITDAIESLTNLANTKSIKFEKNLQENLPSVSADPNKLIQVLNNLMGNAIKFTPKEGKITLEASLAEEGFVRVCVKDTGPGIPNKEDLVKIFDKFYQTKEKPSTDIKGTGIGLPIVRELVTLHGGRVWAESEPGQGARFIFTLPIKPPQPAQESAETEK